MTITTRRLPGTNSSAGISNSDIDVDQRYIQDEFLERMRLMFGHPDWISSSSFGIVSDDDPSTHETGSTNWLVITDSGSLSINVNSGYAVTKSGFRIWLRTAQNGIALATQETGGVNIVTLKYTTGNPDSQSLSIYGKYTYRWRTEATDLDKVAVYSDSEWLALTQSDRDDHVIIGVATIQVGVDGLTKEVRIDLGQTAYPENRSWFSPADIKHRGFLGTGTSSSTNPHATSFSDLTIGSYSLPQLVQQHGLIISPSQYVAHVPGSVCTVDIPGVETDDVLGTITGLALAKYFKLSFIPVRLGEVYNALTPFTPYAFVLVPGTNIVRQAQDTYPAPDATALTCVVTRVQTLEPKTITLSSRFTVESIQTNDLVLAGGVLYTSDSTTDLSDVMGDAGPIPHHYDFYFTGGTIIKNPQVLMCRTLISAMSTAITPAITQFDAGVVLVALDSSSKTGMTAEIVVQGTDIDGNAGSETLTFTEGNWTQGPAIPSDYTPTEQFLRGTTLWTSITSISLGTITATGENAAFQVWIMMHTTQSELKYATHIATGQWDATKISIIKDRRLIACDLVNVEPIDNAVSAALQTVNIDDRAVLVAENFLNPLYGSLIDPTFAELHVDEPRNNRLSSTDRTKPSLWGRYESRALYKSKLQNILYIRLLPHYTNFTKEGSAAFWELPTVKISEQQHSDGVWCGYADAPYSSGYKAWVYNCTEISSAFKIKIYNAYGFTSMIVYEDVP